MDFKALKGKIEPFRTMKDKDGFKVFRQVRETTIGTDGQIKVRYEKAKPLNKSQQADIEAQDKRG